MPDWFPQRSSTAFPEWQTRRAPTNLYSVQRRKCGVCQTSGRVADRHVRCRWHYWIHRYCMRRRIHSPHKQPYHHLYGKPQQCRVCFQSAYPDGQQYFERQNPAVGTWGCRTLGKLLPTLHSVGDFFGTVYKTKGQQQKSNRWAGKSVGWTRNQVSQSR